MLDEPEILILDEPTVGLDPEERIKLRNYISEISTDRTVMLATHIVGDIESIAREVIIMKNGIIVKSGPPAELIKEVFEKTGKTVGLEEVFLYCFGVKK